MKVSALELRRKMKEIMKTLDRKEPVVLYYRGRKRAVIYPVSGEGVPHRPVEEDPAVGIWKDREDMQDVGNYVRKMRKERHNAF